MQYDIRQDYARLTINVIGKGFLFHLLQAGVPYILASDKVNHIFTDIT